MAVPAKPNQAEDIKRAPAEVVPMPRPAEPLEIEEAIAKELPPALPEVASPTTFGADSDRRDSSAMIDDWKDSASRMYDEARFRLSDAYGEARNQMRLLTDRVQSRVAYMKREQPWQLLGIVAIASFAAGVAIRTWRSK